MPELDVCIMCAGMGRLQYWAWFYPKPFRVCSPCASKTPLYCSLEKPTKPEIVAREILEQ